MAKVYEKKIEVALFEIQKMFEYCHQNIDSTNFQQLGVLSFTITHCC